MGFGAELSPDVELCVEGMMCQKNCGNTVKNALEAVPGIARAEASFSERRAKVWTTSEEEGGGGGGGGRGATDGGGENASAAVIAGVVAGVAVVVVEEQELVDALECVGFEASVAPGGVLEVEGMMCQRNCGSTVKGGLEAVPGVERAEVSFAEKRARVWWTRGVGASLPLSTLVDAVEAVGFGARVVSPEEEKGGEGGVGAGAGAAPVDRAARRGEGEEDDEEEVEVPLPKLLGLKEVGGGGGGGALTAVGVLKVSGMSCASCVGNVERFVLALEGVEEVRVALLAEKVRRAI